MEQSQVDTDQNGLHLVFGASGLVHEHLLGDVLPPLHAVQPVIGVAVQHRPAQELRQGLAQTARGRNTSKQEATQPSPCITMMHFQLLLLPH